jgi:hypothetical protein
MNKIIKSQELSSESQNVIEEKSTMEIGEEKLKSRAKRRG